MILQQLYNDADAILKQATGQSFPPSMYLLKKIRWIIELNDGQPAQLTSLIGEGKSGERGLEMLVPNWKRAAGVRPLLFADKTSYVLGIRVPDAKLDANRDLDKDAVRTVEEFTAFKQLAGKCAEQTNESDAKQIVAFLDAWNPQSPSIELPADLTRDNFFTFRVNGCLIVDNPKIRQFWAGYGQAEEAEEGAAQTPEMQMQCLVSGLRGSVEEMMPVPVKGLPGGKSEMAIVSANAAAFESYGLRRAQTSPICRDAGERFGQALNALLASPNHHALLQNTTYIFWSSEATVKLALFDPEDAKKFLNAVRSGKRYYEAAPKSAFYLFGLTPNAARVAVRSAILSTIGDIEARQKQWFERLSILGFDDMGKPITDRVFSIKTLAIAAYRDFKDIAPFVEDCLLRAALMGEPVPATLLHLLVNRCRVERTVTHTRAALMKYIITQHWDNKEASSMFGEVTNPHPPGLDADEARAYHLGRLFAELEAVQSQAIPGLNAGITDKFYGSAASTPASVFGLLLEGVQNHLAKLRKEKENAYKGAQKRIEDIALCIDHFPKTLPLKSQALFSLGYYHHRAERRKTIMEASAAKKAAQATTAEIVSDDSAYTQGENDD